MTHCIDTNHEQVFKRPNASTAYQKLTEVEFLKEVKQDEEGFSAKRGVSESQSSQGRVSLVEKGIEHAKAHSPVMISLLSLIMIMMI